MKFNQGDIAEIYGYDWATLVADKEEGKIGYLRGKLDNLNKVSDLQSFAGYLDKENLKNFKRVLKTKLEGLL